MSSLGPLFELAILGWLFKLALKLTNLLFLGPFRIFWRSHPRRGLVSDLFKNRSSTDGGAINGFF